MEARSFLIRTSDVVLRAVLVLLAAVCTPLPSVLWFVLVDEWNNTGYSYSEDGPWLSSVIIFMIVAVVYAVIIVPSIWRKRFFTARRAAA